MTKAVLPVRIGLTGSIGMGKTTTARMFADAGVAVFDADAAVHSLYRGEALEEVAAAFPDACVDGTIERDKLSAYVVGNKANLAKLEAIVHPLVRRRQEAFIAAAAAAGAKVVVVDIPLLFETNAQDNFDLIVVVTASASVQRARVLARPGMSEARFEALLRNQVPDRIKRQRADFVIDTGLGFAHARAEVDRIVEAARRMR